MARLTKAQMLARSPVARALHARPIPDKLWRDLSMVVTVSLGEAMQGTAKVEHRDALASVVNTMLVLTERHCTPDSLDVIRGARDAILRADARHAAGLRWALDGEGIRALKDAVAGQDALTRELGVGDFTDAVFAVDAMLKGNAQSTAAQQRG